MIKFLATFLIFSCSQLFAGTIDPSTPDQKYVEYGSKFNSVVRICCIDSQGRKACGSAVIIDPHWIITAAHVVNGGSECRITLEDKEYCISKIFCHKDYCDNIFGKNDIALGYIQEDIHLNFYPTLYNDSDETGKVCSIAGLGLTGTFETGVSHGDSKKRAGSNTIDRAEEMILICSPSRKYGKFTELEYMIASGDSGGGLFIEGKLAGIHSSVMAYDGKPNSSYGDESCHTRISRYAHWIKDCMKVKP